MLALAALLREVATWRWHGGNLHQAAAARAAASLPKRWSIVDGASTATPAAPPAADHAADTLRRPRG
jgi:hypothetical protein